MTTALSPRQTALYAAATEADKRYRQVKLDAHAEAQRIVEQAVAQALAERDMAVRRAFDAGVRKALFRRRDGGLHTTNQDAINQVLARTEHFAELDAAVEEAVVEATGGARYAIDADGHLVITPPTEELQAIAGRLDLEADTVVPASARFVRTRFGKLDPVDGVSIPGTIDRNPAVMWAAQPEHEAAALAWWSTQTTAA